MEPRIQYARTSDGVSIAYSVMGEGQPLVYTSNVFGDLHWYLHNEPTRQEIDRLVASGWQVVRYDIRGMGSSDRDVSDFSLTARVKDLEAVVDDAKIGSFVLCGYSEGGPPAIAYTVGRPERVSHLILVNSFALGSAYYAIPVMRALSGMRAMAEEQWELFTQTVATLALGFEDTALAKKTAELFRSASSPKAYLAFSRAAEKIDVRDRLSDVRVPTLVVLARSGYVTEGPSRALASNIPNARLVRTDDYPSDLNSFVRGQPLALKPEGVPSGTAIILFADIVDSTALTERLGDAAFRTKARALDTSMREIIRKNSGTPIEGKLLGDGVLAVFASAKDAIDAALACARAGDAALPLHLGVHAGDVIREENNIYGGAVNIASRISGLSAPGEVLVSETVRSLARTSAGVRFADRGEQALKGIEDPVRVYAAGRD